jgi:hypothetical protein
MNVIHTVSAIRITVKSNAFGAEQFVSSHCNAADNTNTILIS